MGTTLAVDAQPLPQQLARLDSERLRAYRENLDFYHGHQWLDTRRRRDRRLTLNYARAVIEKTASYTMSGANFVADPEDDSPEAIERARRTERIIRDVYEANGLEHLDFDNEIDCSVLGDAAYKVWWDAAEERVRVSAPDVQGLFVWPCAGDHARFWKVAARYTLSHAEAESTLGPLPAKPSSWSAPAEHTIIEAWTADTFELWLDGDLLEENANPYGFIPFVIYPNVREPKRFWGISDLEAIKEPLRELNRAVSQLSTILELSGNPIAVLENVTEAQDIAVQPGAVWELPEKARAYLLDLLHGGGASLHVEYASFVLRMMHDLAEVPRSAFGETHQALSGIAFQMELDPLLKKVQRKRLIEQHTGETFAPYRTRVVWPQVMPQDRTRLVDEEARLVSSGIHSRRTAAVILDVADPDAEFQRWRQELDEITASPGP